eukprot:CAMPEP_0113462186 /NCGR_PEP_ID=MMETSP0014_2-20120614/11947_1 /TAXON_ID=2857 /ORGANISM="Nitzschia sp." /LENGTH=133 /DNA_ID=CAMNT_0000354011 /DNA_START=285 /DNA_END=686 /DNA_ORIENTATION=+ /assembly_acc=CAM_ASM_000159
MVAETFLEEEMVEGIIEALIATTTNLSRRNWKIVCSMLEQQDKPLIMTPIIASSSITFNRLLTLVKISQQRYKISSILLFNVGNPTSTIISHQTQIQKKKAANEILKMKYIKKFDIYEKRVKAYGDNKQKDMQ